MVRTQGLAAGSKCTPPLIRGGAMSAQPAVSHPSWVVGRCMSEFVCTCVYASVHVNAGQVFATSQSAQMQLGHLDRETAGDCK